MHILEAMKTRSFADIQSELLRRQGQWRQCAEDLSINYSTVFRIAKGDTPSPRIDTVDAIYDWLMRNPPKKRVDVSA